MAANPARSGRAAVSTRTHVEPSSIAPAASASSAFLGKSGVPRIGLGLAALGRPGYINLGHGEDLQGRQQSVDAMRDHCHEVLDAAYAAGIRYFDAARSYGLAESFLSEWLRARGLQPSQVAVGSKWGYAYTADWRIDTGGEPHEVKEHSLQRLEEQSAESAALLGDYMDVYQVHSATVDSGALSEEVTRGLWELRHKRGWRIGLSLSGTGQAETLRAAMRIRDPETGAMLFQCVQATWNPLEQSAGEALIEAREAGMDVIVKEAMANGRLTARNTAAGAAGAVAALRRVADQAGVGVDAVVLACALRQPFAPVVLSGASTPATVRSNVEAIALAARMTDEEVEGLLRETRQPSEANWRDRAQLAWN